MQVADPANAAAVAPDRGAAARVAERAGVGAELGRGVGQGQQGLDVGLEVVEVHFAVVGRPLLGGLAATGHGGDARGFQRRPGGEVEHATQFEQPHARLLAGAVAAQRGHQAGQQRGAHDAEFAAQRVGQGYRAFLQLPGGQQVTVHEGVVDRFQVVAAGELAAQHGVGDAALRRRGQADLAGGRGGGNRVVAVDAGDLFDQVFFDGDVEAARRRHDRPAFGRGGHLHAQRAQDALDLGVGHGDAQHARQARAAQGHGLRLRQVFGQRGFGDGAGAAAHHLQHQRGGALERVARQLRIHAALEAVRGVGVQADAARAADDGRRREVRAFKEHAGGGVGDARIPAAHHARQRHRALAVGDHQEAVVERGLAFVEQLEGFAGAAAAYADRARQRVGVKGVHRLAQFEHHVVGDVHQRADRAQAGALEALGHPQRRTCGGVHAFDDPAAVARAVGAGVQGHVQRGLAGDGGFGDFQRIDLGRQRRGHVEGHAAHAEAVGAVGRELELEAGVGQAQELGHRRAHGGVGGKFQQARGIGVDAQLLGRAQHALRIHAAQLGGLDGDASGQRGADRGQRRLQARARVGRAADDLHRAGAGGDLAHLQAVGLGVFFAGQDFSHEHAVQAFAQHLRVLDFQADGGEARGQLVARGGYGDVLAQPAFGELHANCLRKRASFSKKLRRSLTP